MKVVAVIGASRERWKFGNKAVRAFHRCGYEVVAINPRYETDDNGGGIEGQPTYPSVLDVPTSIDLATFYVPPSIGEQVVADVAAKQIPEVWLNPGAESEGLIGRARELGLETRLGCSIVAIGETPSDYV